MKVSYEEDLSSHIGPESSETLCTHGSFSHGNLFQKNKFWAQDQEKSGYESLLA